MLQDVARSYAMQRIQCTLPAGRPMALLAWWRFLSRSWRSQGHGESCFAKGTPWHQKHQKSEEKLQPSRGEDNRVEEVEQLCKLRADQLKGYCMSTGMPLVCELETAAEHLQRHCILLR